MPRYSPSYHSPPRRGYGGRERSPPRRGYSGSSSRGGYGRRNEQSSGSLLVRNIPMDCRPEELRVPFERFGVVRDVYLPKDYHTGEPRGFAFVQFVDAYNATEAQYHMNGKIFAGREITVVVAAERRKQPEEMRHRARDRAPSGYGGRRSSHYGHSRSRSVSRSPSPRYRSNARKRQHSRSYSPSPEHRAEYPVSPNGRHTDHRRSPRNPVPERVSDRSRRSYSPGYDDATDRKENSGHEDKPSYGSEEGRARRKSPTVRARVSRSPSRSRSRLVDLSPYLGERVQDPELSAHGI